MRGYYACSLSMSYSFWRLNPSSFATLAFGTPSAASLLINAQSSKVITLQVSSAHFPPGRTAQFVGRFGFHGGVSWPRSDQLGLPA